MIEIYHTFFIINNIFYNKKFKYKILQFNIFHLQTIIYILFYNNYNASYYKIITIINVVYFFQNLKLKI